MQIPEARLQEMESRFEEIERLLGDPALAQRPDELRSWGQEHAHLKDTVEAWREYRRVADDLSEARSMLNGSSGEERAYVESEIALAIADRADRRREALQLVLYNLTKLETHMHSGQRILNDLRTLRRLLLDERGSKGPTPHGSPDA